MAGAGRIKGITIEIGGNTTKLVASLKDVDKQIKNTQTALKDVNNLLKLDPGNTELLRQKQKLLGDAVNETKDRLKQLEEAQAGVAKGTPEWDALQREIIETQHDLDGLEKDLKDFGGVGQQKLKVLSDNFKELGQKIQDAGAKVSEVGKGLTAKVTAPIVGGLAACTKAAVSFEDAMAKVNTIADTSETGVALEDLQKQILELSNETGIASTEIADNVYNAISAGQKTGDAVNFVGEATKLAVAGFAETGDALDILTTVMNAYGMEAKDVTRVSNVLISTQNLGKTTVAELSAAMGKAIPTAKANGVEIEDLAGAYAVMTSNGIATAETTTYLNSMMNELGKKGTTAAKAFAEGTKDIKKGGLTMKEAMESGWELSDVLAVLDKEAGKSGTTIANMFGSAEAGKAANVLFDNTQKLNDAVTAMGKSTGATDEAFAKMDTTSRQAQIALNELKNSAIDLGGTVLTMLAPYIKLVIDKIKEVTDWFKNLDEGQKQQIVKILGIVAAIGPLLVIIGQVISLIGTITTVIGVLASPIGLVIAGITALVAAFTYFYATNEDFRNAVNTTVTAIVNFLKPVFEWIKQQFIQMYENIKSHIELIKVLIQAFGIAVDYLKTTIANACTNIKNTFINLKNSIVETFTNLVNRFKQWGSDMITNLVQGIKDKFNAVKDAVANVGEIISSYLHFSEPDVGPLSNFSTYAPDMMQLFASGIRNNANLITDAISSSFDLRPYFTSMANGIDRMTSVASTSMQAQSKQGPVLVNVSLEGDAQRMFRVLADEAHRDWQITGQSRLMGY